MFLSEAMFSANVISEVSAGHEIHDKVQRIPILEGLSHIDDEFMFEESQKFSLVSNGLVAFFCEDPT